MCLESEFVNVEDDKHYYFILKKPNPQDKDKPLQVLQ
jgi:hypothetical protein